jgi:DNA-binding response OmpR family regulator
MQPGNGELLMKRILLCDDEPRILEGLRLLLRQQDRTIDVASRGKQALRLIQEHKPDLLIVDIMMPEMSGLEVVATLRESQETHDLPIIILTAKGQAQDAVMAQETWGATVISKPFAPRELRNLVSGILESGRCPRISST